MNYHHIIGAVEPLLQLRTLVQVRQAQGARAPLKLLLCVALGVVYCMLGLCVCDFMCFVVMCLGLFVYACIVVSRARLKCRLAAAAAAASGCANSVEPPQACCVLLFVS